MGFYLLFYHDLMHPDGGDHWYLAVFAARDGC